MSKRSNYYDGKKGSHCYFCGAFGGLEEHHIVPQRFGGSDSEGNIVPLCSQCHTKIERLYDKSFYEEFGIEDEEGKRQFHTTCWNKECKNLSTQHWESNTGVEFYACENHVPETWRDKPGWKKLEEVEVDR